LPDQTQCLQMIHWDPHEFDQFLQAVW
jgi:hypothetical protein